jgi:hypothetical protein
MKKILLWFGGIFLLLIGIFVISMAFARIDKGDWDEFSENHAKTVVNSLSDMSKEQFENYWGDQPPGTPEQRDKMIQWASSFGTLQKIDSVERVNYMTKVTLKGIFHFYVYDVHATYGNSPLIVRLWFRIHGDDLEVQNMVFNPVAGSNTEKAPSNKAL